MRALGDTIRARSGLLYDKRRSVLLKHEAPVSAGAIADGDRNNAIFGAGINVIMSIGQELLDQSAQAVPRQLALESGGARYGDAAGAPPGNPAQGRGVAPFVTTTRGRWEVDR